MRKALSTSVFIGRFQPVHKGHIQVIETGLSKSDRLIVLVGSANISRSIRNPWNFEERKEMLLHSIPNGKYINSTGRLLILPLNDYLYNDTAWVSNVQRIVEENRLNGEINLIGFSKDQSSYYLKLFPGWNSINVPQTSVFNATDIRKDYFRSNPIIASSSIDKSTREYLNEYQYTDSFRDMVAEAEAISKYKESWKVAPFPPTFLTVDAVVVQSGHILLIERGEIPGKGLLALPGGFLDQNETLVDGAVRELKEETKISDKMGEIPPAKLRSFITAREVFDHPDRSTRGRTVTTAFKFELPDSKPMYQVKGSDDAAEAKWYPIGTVQANEFFEDHYFIMCKMLGLTLE